MPPSSAGQLWHYTRWVGRGQRYPLSRERNLLVVESRYGLSLA